MREREKVKDPPPYSSDVIAIIIQNVVGAGFPSNYFFGCLLCVCVCARLRGCAFVSVSVPMHVCACFMPVCFPKIRKCVCVCV